MTSGSPKPGLKSRLWKNLLKTHPFIILRITAVWILLSPWFAVSLLLSSLKATRLSKLSACKAFLRHHASAFPDIDPDSLRTESLSGGVSNSNHLWHCKTFSGKSVTFFVKSFVPIGTFWAKNLSLVSPFPKVDAITCRGRFKADLEGRRFLTGKGFAVPKLIAFDEKEQRLVTEYLEGGNFDSLLRESGRQGILSPGIITMIQDCGSTLGRIHNSGYSLVDAQPINCIASVKGPVYFTDLEFCTRRNRKTWDAAFFLCFLGIHLDSKLQLQAAELFREAYEKEAGALAPAELNKTEERLKPYIPTFKTILTVRGFRPEELMEEIFKPEITDERYPGGN